MKKALNIVLSLILCCAMLLSGCGCKKDGHSASGVTVMGIDVGEKTKAEVVKILGEVKFDESAKVKISADGITFEIAANEIGASFNVEKTADYVVNEGKKAEECTMVVDIDQKLLDEVITKKMGEHEIHVQQTSVKATEEGIEITNGKTGMQIDRAEALAKISAELGKSAKNEIKLTLVETAPDTVDYNSLLSGFDSEFEESRFVKEEDGTITVIEGVAGVQFDKESAVEMMKAHTLEGEVYVIPCTVTVPKSKTELEEGLFRDTLATYSSNFSTSSANRCENIILASNSINGIILMPGDVFSFNDALGERTTERGYKAAGAYANGQTVTSVGGGICQVSSTLYNTALLANLEIVERRSHQMTVGYVPLGRDATVNWGTQDFKFKNNSMYPVKIVSEIEGKNVAVTAMGTFEHPDMKVVINTSTISVLEPVEEIVEDPEKEVGFTETEKGNKGYVVDATRVVYHGDEEVLRESLTRSRYNPTKTITTVGTKPLEEDVPVIETVPGVETEPGNEEQMPPGLLPPEEDLVIENEVVVPEENIPLEEPTDAGI